MINNINIKRTTDFYPKKDKNYFKNSDSKDCLAVIIPFFNETSFELKSTLKSLFICYKFLCKKKPIWLERGMKIIIIQDGWYKSSDSMKEYLKQLYNTEDKWWEKNDFINYNQEKDGSITYIFEKDNKTCINQEEYEKGDEIKKELDITMMIKIDNRKKHNSHEWFMGSNGFGEATKSKYMFCTDAFTMFNKACIYHLVNYLDNNDNVSVATGRQRVMTKQQQQTDEIDYSLQSMLRNVQLFDFESSNALYNGAFSLGGYLPVIPGPCGLYRSSDVLQDNVRYWYFDIVNKEPHQTGLVLGNLRIAEDRILSYSVVLKTKEERKMAFIPLSIFYFEAELELEKFILQRRRWINGSIAGYFYLLVTDTKHLSNWRTNIFRKIYVTFLLFCQLLTYCIVGIAPAVSLNIFLYSSMYVLSYTSMNYITNETICYLATLFFSIIYINHMFIHHKNKYNNFIIQILLVFSFITSILTIISLILFGIKNKDNLLLYLTDYKNVYLYLILAVFFLPFINSILISGRMHSFFYMIKSYLSYFLFSHMLISTFGSYSYSRIWDLSWGNRPTTELTTNITKEELNKSQEKFKSKSVRFIYLLILLNVIVFFLPKNISFYILGTYFSISFLQMILTFLYFIKFIPEKIKFIFNNIKNKVTITNILQEEMEKDNKINDIENDKLENEKNDIKI